MSKIIASVLAGFLLFSVFLVSPDPLCADKERCYDEYDICRQYILGSHAGIIKMVRELKMCELALLACVIVDEIRNQ